MIAEIELQFVFGIESDDRGEGPALPAAETLQRAELFVADQRLDFLRLHEPARQKRGQAEVALLTLEPAIILLDHGAALGARSFEIAEIARHFIARIRFGALDNVPGHVGDLFHELRTREPPVLHLLELELPFAGQFRLRELLDAQPAQQRQQHECLAGGLQFGVVPMDVLLGNQVLDDLRARRRRAESALGHRFAQFLVLDELAGAFHRAEQGGFGKARRRFGLRLLHFDFLRLHAFACLDGHELVAAFTGLGGLAAIDFKPAGLHEHLALAFERLALDAGDARGDQELRRRIKDREKTPHDHVVNLLLGFGKVMRHGVGGDDGEVVAHLRVVEDALVGPHPVLRKDGVGKGAVSRAVHFFECVLDRGEVVLRQMTRVGAWVGQHLVLFVKRLCDAQRVLGGETEAPIAVALQAGQVEKRR